MITRVRAVSFIKVMSHGRTKPCLMLCEDQQGNQEEVVVKLRAGVEVKEAGLVSELMAAQFASDLDLPVPKPGIVEIEAGFDAVVHITDVAAMFRDSVGLNFGSQKLPNGFNTWPKDKPIPMLLRPLAAEIFAFDLLVQNLDRRRDRPNVLWKGDDLFIIDHELAFSFITPTIGWQPPWTGQGLEFMCQHVFYDGLSGTEVSLDRLTGAIEAITDEQLQEYEAALPDEWKAKTDAAAKIVGYLKEARQNLDKIVAVTQRALQ